MELEEFARVVTYTLNPNTQPTPTTISAVRSYNTIRVQAAKKHTQGLPACIVQPLRKASSIQVIPTVPQYAKCIISKQFIKRGCTLIINNGELLFTVRDFYQQSLRTLFLIFHFDDEIHKAYNEWTQRYIQTDIQSFTQYNQSSHIKKLFVVFQQLCYT